MSPRSGDILLSSLDLDRSLGYLEDYDTSPVYSPLADMLTEELLPRLSLRFQELIRQHYWDGLSLRRYARRHGMHLEQVRRELAEAIAELRVLLLMRRPHEQQESHQG